MQVLRETYSLVLNDVVYAKVRAYNALGWSASYTESSSVGAATVKTAPTAPSTTVQRGSLTSATQIEVTWATLTGDAAGQDPITRYEIDWDAGTNGVSYTNIVNSTSAVTTSAIITEEMGLVSGTLYRFRYRAVNQQGAGAYSSVSSIYAATAPSGLSAPTTTVSGSDIVVDWSPPSNTGGLAITSYTVQI